MISDSSSRNGAQVPPNRLGRLPLRPYRLTPSEEREDIRAAARSVAADARDLQDPAARLLVAATCLMVRAVLLQERDALPVKPASRRRPSPPPTPTPTSSPTRRRRRRRPAAIVVEPTARLDAKDAAQQAEAERVAEAVLADLVHIASADAYWSHEAVCLLNASAVNTRWYARMLEAGLLDTTTPTGTLSKTKCTPTAWLRRNEKMQKANGIVYGLGAPRIIDGKLNMTPTEYTTVPRQVPVLEQVTAPEPPPSREHGEAVPRRRRSFCYADAIAGRSLAKPPAQPPSQSPVQLAQPSADIVPMIRRRRRAPPADDWRS